MRNAFGPVSIRSLALFARRSNGRSGGERIIGAMQVGRIRVKMIFMAFLSGFLLYFYLLATSGRRRINTIKKT